MESFLEFLKNLNSEQFIWWSGLNEKGYKHNRLLRKFLKNNNDVEMCIHNNNWLMRKLINIMPITLKEKFDNDNKPYISKYFSRRKKILIATNNDVGIKEMDIHSLSVVDKYQRQFNFSKIGKYIMQNPTTGIGYPHIRDSFESIPKGVMIYSKALSVKNNPQLKPLPNGINWENAEKRVVFIKSLHKIQKKHLNLLYINLNKPKIGSFGKITNDERPMLVEMFNDKNYVTHGEGRGNQFLNEIYHHTFCLSPEGNCADSHRTWESLYLGTIPIVKKTDAMSWFEDLPILQINSWDEITKNYLEEQYEIISKKEFNFEKLKMSYYLNLMQNDLNAKD